MVNRYKKTIIQLIDKVLLAKENPFGNPLIWLEVQEKILAKIIYIEKRILFSKRKNKIP